MIIVNHLRFGFKLYSTTIPKHVHINHKDIKRGAKQFPSKTERKIQSCFPDSSRPTEVTILSF